MKTWQKWLLAVFSVLLLAGITLGVVWMVDNWSAITSNTTLYTQEDLDNAYNEGLNDAGYDVIIQYQEQIAGLQIELQNKEITIGNLTDQLNDALENGGLKDDEIEDLEQQIENMEIEIDTLEDTVTELQLLLEAYQNIDKLRVTFVLFDNNDETPYKVQLVDENGYLSEVETPEGSDFEGWSLIKGGDIIDDLTTIQVTENMTIYGMFTNTVTFMVQDAEYTTQEVSYNKYATDVEVTLAGYTFNGWSLTEGGETISLSTTPITADTTFYAVFSEKNTFEAITWNIPITDDDLINRNMSNIWTDGINIYYSYYTENNNEQYVLNKETLTWEEKTWYGLDGFNGYYVWNFKDNVYYSDNYVLNKETLTWEEKTWYLSTGSRGFDSTHIFTDGTDVFLFEYTAAFILDEETDTFNKLDWNYRTDIPNITAVWTDGVNIYWNDSDDSRVLNKETLTWEEKTWTGLTSFNGRDIWTDGNNIYYSSSSNQYQLDKETSTWTEKTWAGLSSFDGRWIWTDGENVYYSWREGDYVLV